MRRLLRREASLLGEQAAEVTRLALTLEATMGYAVDVECAYAQGELAKKPASADAAVLLIDPFS